MLLALFLGGWCGTFAGGATAGGAAAAVAALLSLLLWVGSPWRDPLRLGTAGSLLPVALWIAALASLWASPVPRAGRIGILLLPIFLWLPGTVERCWRSEEDRRWGLRGVALVVAAVALWSLLDWLVLGAPRPAMPLGHHNLLSAWLVILLPLALLPAREKGAWRWAGWAGGGLALCAVLASRSLSGMAALVIEALLGLVLLGRHRRLAALLVLLALGSQLPRLARIATGEDASARARGAYLEAGWEGFRENPILGWGPGAAPWTASAFLDGVPGGSAWGEIVGELHSLPLQLAYELGATGLLLGLAVIVVFVVRRLAERRTSRDRALLAGGLLGLAGACAASLGGGAITVTALPLAAAIAAGASLAAVERRGGGSALPVRVAVTLIALLLVPLLLAHWHYDRAVAAGLSGRRDEARAELARAVDLDPSFPLYRLRLALLQERTIPGRAAGAELAWGAARQAVGVPAFWTVAGVLGASAERPWAAEALERACALEPLNPFPPFYRMLLRRRQASAPIHGAHALLAEPRLAAAVFWESHPDLLDRSLQEVRLWPGVDAGWKEAFLAAVPSARSRQGTATSLALSIDTQPNQSLSLTLFRRRPWPVQWPLVKIHGDALDLLGIPPASSLASTPASALSSDLCRGQILLTR
jgi:hypothetical protein